MPIFEVIVIKNPTQAERENGKLEEIVLESPRMVSKDERSASMKIMLDNKETIEKYGTDNLEVLVRPF